MELRELEITPTRVQEAPLSIARGRRFDGRNISRLLPGLAICAVPASIALTESLLACSLLVRLIALFRGRSSWNIPRVFWFWLAWAVLELASWLQSPEIHAGWGEIRHLLLIAALFLIFPALDSARANVTIWRGIVTVATLSSIVLITRFVARLFSHPAGVDPIVYLRGGGLLNHWMLYAIVETLVFAALLELWHFFPDERRWLLPAAAINITAILLSLTRTLWLCCLLLLTLHLLWTRSRWIVAVPLIPCVLFLLAPGVVRSRITESAQPDYYANAERLQMLRVGFQMVRDNPLTGMGPGRVDELYTKYLAPKDPVPAYHGHLHNNVVQLAAEFGLPAIASALVFVAVLFHDLLKRCIAAGGRDQRCLCRTSVLGLTGFLFAGMFDYTYGHSIGIILLGFTVLAPLATALPSACTPGPAPPRRKSFPECRCSGSAVP